MAAIEIGDLGAGRQHIFSDYILHTVLKNSQALFYHADLTHLEGEHGQLGVSV